MSILRDIFHAFFPDGPPPSPPVKWSVDELLDARAAVLKAETGEDLNWRKSLVDRMKVLGIGDEATTFKARQRIAAYYGIEGYQGTAEDNADLADAITDDLLGRQ